MKTPMTAGLLLLACVPAMAREPAPAADCVDARRVDDARFVNARVLALSAAGKRYRLDLAVDCPLPTSGTDVTLVGPQGWVCGDSKAFVRAGERTCPIAAVHVLGVREYAVLARQAVVPRLTDDDVAALAPVEVRAKRRRGFAGSPHFCFNVRDLRAWNQTPAGVQVQVSPRRSGGYSGYQVEMEGACPELRGAETVAFRSGVGIGQICGHPGDHLAVVDDRSWVGIIETGFDARRPAPRICRIRAVYPLESAPSHERGIE